MKRSVMGAMTFAVIATLAACATAGTKTPADIGRTAKGATLVDTHGMTLYVFDKDANGKSFCNGPCAVNWPPLMAQADSAVTGDYAIIIRDDGSRQWAYKGRPLYTWKNDRKPGDTTGDGFLDNTWHVAQP